MTHKMNPHQRAARFDREAVSLLVRQHVIWERDLGAALAAFMQFPVVRKHVQAKSPAQLRVFEAHVQRYLQAYLPDAGFEYAITHRYSTARRRRAEQLGREHPEPWVRASDCTDLCVLALRSFQPDEVITCCRAALKDLTRADDEALREEAMQARTADARRPPPPQRDFSIIRSSSRKTSQLLLGPARFINHDCQPNAEFRRSGHQLTIRAIRAIQRDEEITTFYGENYFELGNRECMCATCERRGRGYFAPPDVAAEPAPAPAPAPEPRDARTLRSASSSAAPPAEPAAPSSPIQPALDPDAGGAECTCLTCQTTFRAPERWWTPDECARCERHYKLYKADWPNRWPDENPAESHSNVRMKRRAPPPPAPRAGKRPALPSESPASSGDTSPVKLSPIRSLEDEELAAPEAQARPRRRKFEVRSDDSDEEFDESHVALGPRILGHQASTDVLASYWGAPSGQRRERRPANKHLEPLTEKRPPSRSHPDATQRETKRRASEAPRAARPEPEPIKREASTPPLPSERPAKARREKAPLDGAEARAAALAEPNGPAKGHRRSASYNDPPRPEPETHDTPKPAIATKGPERTSVSNLALFWSGGVEGRTRQQARTQRATSEPHAKPARDAGVARRDASAAPVSAAPPAPPAPPAPTAPSTPPAPAIAAAPPAPSVEQSPSARPSPVPSEPRIKAEASPRVLSPQPSPGPPRQPARRNLRWGNGKTSISRPLPGAPTSTGISLLDAITARVSPASPAHASDTGTRAMPDRRTPDRRTPES